MADVVFSTESLQTDKKVRQLENESNQMEVDSITKETRFVEANTTQLSPLTMHIPDVSSVTPVPGTSIYKYIIAHTCTWVFLRAIPFKST